jgi:hypothetical protein
MTSRISLLLLSTLFLASCAHIREADGARRPKTEMSDAISIARSYIHAHKIDVSDQFLGSVTSFHDVYKPEKTGWHLTWVPADPFTLDGEWSIYVYDDGHVKTDGE